MELKCLHMHQKILRTVHLQKFVFTKVLSWEKITWLTQTPDLFHIFFIFQREKWRCVHSPDLQANYVPIIISTRIRNTCVFSMWAVCVCINKKIRRVKEKGKVYRACQTKENSCWEVNREQQEERRKQSHYSLFIGVTLKSRSPKSLWFSLRSIWKISLCLQICMDNMCANICLSCTWKDTQITLHLCIITSSKFPKGFLLLVCVSHRK